MTDEDRRNRIKRPKGQELRGDTGRWCRLNQPWTEVELEQHRPMMHTAGGIPLARSANHWPVRAILSGSCLPGKAQGWFWATLVPIIAENSATSVVSVERSLLKPSAECGLGWPPKSWSGRAQSPSIPSVPPGQPGHALRSCTPVQPFSVFALSSDGDSAGWPGMRRPVLTRRRRSFPVTQANGSCSYKQSHLDSKPAHTPEPAQPKPLANLARRAGMNRVQGQAVRSRTPPALRDII